MKTKTLILTVLLMSQNMFSDTVSFYQRLVREKCAQRRARLLKITTRQEAEAYRFEVRQKIKKCFETLPETSPLNARITGKLETGKLFIDKITFESRPGFIVTGLFYRRQDISGKMPGILMLCGHNGLGKAAPVYQKTAQSLALRGYAVVIIDPIGQGERSVSPDIARGTGQHNMLGRHMLPCGEFLGTWRLWDAIRALDYLTGRPEVDSTHIGVTGTSGGGMMTSWLTAFDSRLTMAAPSCYITTIERNIENGNSTDAEQNPPAFLADGLELADFIIAAAPRPTLIMAQRNDFFDLRGTLAAYEEIKQIYSLLGKPDQIKLHIGEGNHGYSDSHRTAAGHFFNSLTGQQTNWTESPDIQLFQESDLNCLPDGASVKPDFLLEIHQRIPRQQSENTVDKIRRLLKLSTPENPDYIVFRPEGNEGRYGIKTEPGIEVILKQFSSEPRFHLDVPEKVNLFIPDASAEPEVVQLSLPENNLFALTVRHAPDRERFLSSIGLMLGQPYIGDKVRDVLAAVELLKNNGAKQIHLTGNSRGSVIAALAALFIPETASVTLYDPLPRWSGAPEEVTAFGILSFGDLPDLYELLADKNLNIVNTGNLNQKDQSNDAIAKK